MVRLLLALSLSFALIGCEAPEHGATPTPAPEPTPLTFLHVNLPQAGLEGDPTGLNLHLVADGGTLESFLDCWTGNASPDWGEQGALVDNPVLSIPLGGDLRQQVVYRFPIDGAYSVWLTRDWGNVSGDATIAVAFNYVDAPHEAVVAVGSAMLPTRVFDVTWPERSVVTP